MRCFRLALLVLFLSPIPLLGATVTLSAGPGQFEAKTLGPHSIKADIVAAISLTEFNGTSAWPTAAYVGFHENSNRDNSIQFVLMRNKDTDTRLAIGYRVLKNGKEQFAEFIDWRPLGAQVAVKISCNEGLVTLQVGDMAPVKIQTSLGSVAPYTSVSSGTAAFDIHP